MGVGSRGGSVSGLFNDNANKSRFSDAKRKPMEKSRMPVFPSEFDYICIWVFLKGGSGGADWRFEDIVCYHQEGHVKEVQNS